MKKIKEEEIKNLQPDYKEEEIAYRADLIQKLTTADTAKNGPHQELNDMTHQEYYDTNVKAANSYIPPKKNLEDTRIVTGTTEEKENTLISSILNYNLESNILAFDKDMLEVDELGKNMEDMIKKSRELENYDEKRVLIYKELMDQGSCFVEEQWVEENKVIKKLKNINWGDGIDVKKISWDEKIEDGFIGCQTRLIRGDKVYLGNIKEFQISKQPYLFTVDMLSYEEAKAIYGKWDRFKICS